MNNSKDYLKSKEKTDHIKEQTAKLRKEYNRVGGLVGLVLGKSKKLSKDNAYIGLVLLNKITELSNNDSDYYWSREIEQNSKRFNALKNISKAQDFWNNKRYPLLEFLFGERMAPYVKKAWDMIPTLMYQEGYTRRSFRGSDLDDIYFTRQLNFIIQLIHEYDHDLTLEEYAIYSNTLPTHSFSFVFASAIEYGDKDITKLFLDAIYGRHDVAKPSKAIIKAMLLTQNSECWIAVEKLLLSAQRQEGLRQTILECLDETSLGAMKHLIKVIIEHKLSRFSSVVRAIDTWAGFGWEAEKETTVRRFLEYADLYLSDPSKIAEAVKSEDNASVYMALWAQGVMDIKGCPPLIDEVLKGNSEKILLALYFIQQVGISSTSIKYGSFYLDYDDPVVVCQSVRLVNVPVFIKMLSKSDKEKLYTKMESQLEKLPKKAAVSKPKVFSWLTFKYSKEQVLDLMINLLNLTNEKDLEKILPYFESLSVEHREKVTRKVLPEYAGYSYDPNKRRSPLNQRKRDFAFSILKDRSEMVKTAAIRALADATLAKEELEVFEGLLTRKAADFRKSVIELIIKQGENRIKESAERLIHAKNEEQRLAGLDLMIWIKKAGSKNNEWLKAKVNDYASRPKLSSKEEVVLTGLQELDSTKEEYTEQNGFGLYEPNKISSTIELIKVDNEAYNKAKAANSFCLSMPAEKVNAALAQLGEIILSYKDHEYTYEDWEEKQTSGLLGNEFTSIKKNTEGMTPEEKFCNYPLFETWRKWYLNSGLTSKDILLINLNTNKNEFRGGDDHAFSSLHNKWSQFVFIPKIPKISEYHWQNPVYKILSNIEERYPFDDKVDFLSALIYDCFTSINIGDISSYKEIKTHWKPEYKTWRDQTIMRNLWNKYQLYKNQMSKVQFATYWNLTYWYYLTSPQKLKTTKTYLPQLYDYVRAYKEGLIEIDQLYWRILHPDAIDELTKKVVGNKYDIKKEFEFLNELINKSRERILEIELIRGDSSTSVTLLAQSIKRLYGVEKFVQLIKALGKDTLHRGYIYSYGNHEYNRKEVLSTLLKNCFPSKSCSQEQFNDLVGKARITEKRLCEAATYAPQWLSYVAEFLGWKDMESAVWWLHAHTNGRHDSQTESEIAKYSSVEITAFRDGAVDINWFKETYKSLKKDKWKKLYNAAKYISDGSGHSRGLLYADVILGNKKITEITERIKDKRNQDYLRVYGVIPLSKASPSKDVLRRYQFLQQFKKESKQFGSQRQTSEGIAVKIAMENLARTAGYPDPIRLQWAMETKEAQEIMQQAGTIQFDDTQVKLEIDNQGKSSIVAIKDGKKLKSVPAKYRKEQALVKLKEYNKTLREQYRRTRKSLENAMVNGDLFSTDEIEILTQHPVVAPMINKLVLVSEGIVGFWHERQLLQPSGELIALNGEVRLAHCVDLFESEKWSLFQEYCFDNKLVQPFKQIFRELYIPTSDELNEKAVSRRYAGHQVQPRKTVALLKGQNWTVDYEEGLQKVNHKQNTIARMFAMADWFSPADTEAPTLETVEFFNRRDGKRLPFDKVDKLVFSETMRDIDLVVSVAHVGEVDPEASQSSIELRTAIVKETCRLFKLNNVSLSENHAKIAGDLGEYSVHLGSGVCHKVASSSISIIPVHSQHRGRLFLPFIDDDPKTSEILSKVLLLAKDKEIKDPTILQQL